MSALAANLAIALAVILAATGALLTGIGFIAWRRTGQGRLAWIAVGLAGLTIQGVWYIRHVYNSRGDIATGAEPFPTLLLLDLVVISAIYFAVLKR